MAHRAERAFFGWSLSSLSPARRGLFAAAGIALSLALFGCTGSNLSNQASPAQATDLATPIVPVDGAPAPKIRVGLLVPLSGERAELGRAMLQAAQLALFDVPDSPIELVVRDDGGTPQQAVQAAQSAIAEGAQLLLGPIFGNAVRAVAPVARNAGVNVVSFSTDKSVAGGGVFVMGILPSLQIERVIGFAGRQGLSQFAVLAPSSPYGQTVVGAAQAAAARAGGSLVATAFYDPNVLDPTMALNEVGQFAMGGGRIDALLIPEGGDRLRGIVPLLPDFGIDPIATRLLGSTLWDDPSLAGNPALAGGWFAAPDSTGWQEFRNRYRAAYAAEPPRLASLAYDATLLAAVLIGEAGGPDFTTAALLQASGFIGVDGIFRFMPDGGVQRGLAVMEIGSAGLVVREPAPESFDQAIF